MRKSKLLEKLIETQTKEIDRLHILVKDLNDKLIVMAGKANMYELKTDNESNHNMSALNMITGQLEAIPAMTEEEKKQKEEARQELHEILNH